MRKLMAVMLMAVLLLGVSGTALAADPGETPEPEKYTLTIKDAVAGHEYAAYQVFAGDLSGDVLSNIHWGSGVGDANGTAIIAALKADSRFVTEEGDNIFADAETAADVAKVLSDEKLGYDSEIAQAFAKVVGAYLIEAEGETSVPGEGVDGEFNGEYKISNLDAGYYLVKQTGELGDDDAYTRFLLHVVGNTEAEVKKAVPTIDKKIVEGSNKTEVNDVSIGDTVHYELTSTVPDMTGYDSYTFIMHDTLSKGLTYKADSLKVTVGGTELTEGTKDDSNTYAVKVEATANGTTITITFNKFIEYTQGDAVVVTYDAVLNENAVIGGFEGNPNEVHLEYSNNPNEDGTGKTTEKEVTTFTTSLLLHKVDEDEEILAGAKFKLEKKVDGAYVTVEEKFVDETTGNLTFKGLGEGDYRLTETVTPDGYNTMEPIEFHIAFDLVGDAKVPTFTFTNKITGSEIEFTQIKDGDNNDTNTYEVTIENRSGSTLPSTGGIGTTIFYVVGTILMLGAAVLLITRKRMEQR